MNNELADMEAELRQLKKAQIENKVVLMLLDMQIEMRKVYPDALDVEPYGRKIVAFCREHIAY